MDRINPIVIGDRRIGTDNPCFIVAEVAQTHEGSLGLAHAFVDVVAAAGADAVKFQTHIADAESSAAEPWRVDFSWQDQTRYDYWRRMEFSETQWRGLKQHAEDKGIVFLSSPFSVDAVRLLSHINIQAWKIPSGEANNPQLLQCIAETGLPIFLSTGMSYMKEIDAAVDFFQSRGQPLAVLQCTSVYPCPPDKIGINLIPVFRDRFGIPIGLSDHSGTIYAGLAAATLGIEILEVHVTLSREMFGPDVGSAITTSEFRQLVDGVRFFETVLSNPINKDQETENLEFMRDIFTKSIFVKNNLRAGTILAEKYLTVKKPGTGIPASELPRLIGKRLARDVSPDNMLCFDDLVNFSTNNSEP